VKREASDLDVLGGPAVGMRVAAMMAKQKALQRHKHLLCVAMCRPQQPRLYRHGDVAYVRMLSPAC